MPVFSLSEVRRILSDLRALGTPDVFAIAVFSYLGVLIRILITSNLDIGNSGEKEVVYCLYTSLFKNSYFVPNILGTFIIGFFSRKKDFFFRTPGLSSYQSFYTGVTTGLCGSLTTFSSWAFSIAENMFEIGTLESIVLAVREMKLIFMPYTLFVIFIFKTKQFKERLKNDVSCRNRVLLWFCFVLFLSMPPYRTFPSLPYSLEGCATLPAAILSKSWSLLC